MDTQESRWEEPTESYWLWDATNQTLDPAGLQQPTTKKSAARPDEEYQGYNPKIHGKYDPTAPYAQFHNKLREEEAKAEQAATAQLPGNQVPNYAASGTFNRFTGNFQTADKSSDRHNDYNKSGRQMNAYFDMDAAANSHEGR
jgi:hypothetical protein